MIDMIDVEWLGPFGWPKLGGKLKPLPKTQGVYLLTVEYQNGFLIYAAGVTGRPMPERFDEHTREYMKGTYNVLDIVAMKAGFRKEVWHGFWMGKNRSHEKQANFKKKQSKISNAARKQLTGFRIFTAAISNKRRRERLEEAIMDCLYKQPMPLCDLPDRGMMLSKSKPSETPLIVKNKIKCSLALYGLPDCLEI